MLHSWWLRENLIYDRFNEFSSKREAVWQSLESVERRQNQIVEKIFFLKL